MSFPLGLKRSAAMVVLRNQGHFLLLKRRKPPNAGMYVPVGGKLEPFEDPHTAAIRETLEETGWTFEPRYLVGVYMWHPAHKPRSFLRVAFAGELLVHDPARPLDRGILRTRWLSRDQLAAAGPRLRSPLVARCVEDYLAGQRYPCELIQHIAGAPGLARIASG